MSTTLMTIPLCQLKRAALNVRKTGLKADIDQLATSIASHGLLENLLVRAVRNGNGKSEPLYEVVAGGRRLAALKLLAKRKTIEPDHPVPCAVLENSETLDLVEVSLAENIMRAPLHPADQFDAFSKLQKDGLSAEEIAARFAIPPKVVAQRLKLGAVSPRLIAAYRADELTLDQLMAFAITDDHAAQETFWFDGPHGDRSPHAIRRHLTQELVDGYDRRARFIGTEAYEAAGGTVIRDLFQPEGEGYFADSRLLDRLVAEKLEAKAQAHREEGWGWVEIMIEADYGGLAKYGQLKPVEVPLPEDDKAKLDTLARRYDELVEKLEEQEDEELMKELDRLDEEMDALQKRDPVWPEDEKKTAGVMLSLSPSGDLNVKEGLVRPEDRKRQAAGKQGSEDGGVKPSGNGSGYSDALLADLTAHRTAALREKIAGDPKVALAALLRRLVLPLFYDLYPPASIDIVPSFLELGSFSKSIGESSASAACLARHSAWRERLPNVEALWDWLMAAEERDLLDLLAHCVALTLDGVSRRYERAEERFAEIDDLTRTVSLDMSIWWQPTRTHFLDHLTKAQIEEAVAEAVSPEKARLLDGLKKAEMAELAEGLLKGSGWLPNPLRMPPMPAEDENAAVEG